jgi:hypothetical protein
MPSGTVGLAYSQTLAATGGDGSYAWMLFNGTTLPAGLSLNADTGEITGTPTTPGVTSFEMEVTSAGQAATRALQITVDASTASNIFFTESFDDAGVAARGWFDNTTFTLTTVERVSGSGSLELRFPLGATVPTFGGTARILFPETEAVYVGYWVKYSANWVGSGRTFHPHEFYLLTNEDDIWVGPSFTHLTAYIEHNYQNGVIPRLATQDAMNIDQGRIGVDLTGVTENRATAGCNGNGDGHPTDCYDQGDGTHNNGKAFDAGQPALSDEPGLRFQNEWHFVEAYFRLNSIQGGIGQSDGVAQYWLDGVLLIDTQDVLFRTGAYPAMAFRELLIGPYIGDGSPVDQSMWVDDLRVGDGR